MQQIHRTNVRQEITKIYKDMASQLSQLCITKM